MHMIAARMDSGGINVNPDKFAAALSRFQNGAAGLARLGAGGGVTGLARRDGVGGSGRVFNLAEYRQRQNAARITRALRRDLDGVRNDAAGFSQQAGVFLARDLEHMHREVLEEQYPVPNALRLFTLDESVPVGANTYTQRRRYRHGEARIWRGPGTKIPRAGMTQREESWPIRHIVAGYGWDIFEAASDNFANAGLIKSLARGARDAIMDLANRIYWQGAPRYGLYGVLTYPWLPKKEIATGFSVATVRANPDLILQELNDLVNFPVITSKGVYNPDTLVLTNRVHFALSNTARSSTSDTTILEFFLKNSPHIKRIEVAWELEDAGGSGVDGMLAYKQGQRGIELVMPQGVTQLPVQVDGLESEIINYASIGSVRITDPLGQVLGYVNTNT